MSMENDEMEQRLRQLLASNDEGRRKSIALEYKKKGKKVIGVLDEYVPEEVIYAAGMLPYRITGTWRLDAPLASKYRLPTSCGYHTHVLESMLAGELDFLDGLVATDWDDDERRLFDACLHVGKTGEFAQIMHVPRGDSEDSCQIFRKWIDRLKTGLEECFGVNITDNSLRRAIKLYNEMRALLMKIYELRKREEPHITGAEILKLVTASFVMPKKQYVEEIKVLLPYIERRKCPIEKIRARLLVSSDRLFHPGYLELVEDVGGLVAMDDMDTGSRYVWELVDTNSSDCLYALAKRYVSRLPCPRMLLIWERQVSQIVEWLKEYHIDGVLNFLQSFSLCQNFGAVYFKDRITKSGVDIPVLNIERDYPLVNEGQIRTRVEAFIEVLENRREERKGEFKGV